MSLETRPASELSKAAAHVSTLKDETGAALPYKPVSADSHVIEPPNCYSDYIDPAYRERAPRVEKNAEGGDVYFIPDIDVRIGAGAVGAAGLDPREVRITAQTYEDMYEGGWDGRARIADQDRDGVAGEIVYPSVGMALCNHPDADYKHACMQAYNRWLQEFQSAAPGRIFGIGQTAVRSVGEAVEDFYRIREMGFYGVMLPNEPSTDMDYDDPAFDPLWQAAVDTRLPLSFHILTSRRDLSIMQGGLATQRNSGKGNSFQNLIRANQDALGLFIWGRVFERFPKLARIVCAEADAGWAPHYIYRMDHFYNRHRFLTKQDELAKLPSEYFLENVYLTFQDDYVAFRMTDMLNPRRLLWANDFPHSDSTWPWSQQLLARQTQGLDDTVRRDILRDNVVTLYGLPV